LPRATLASRYHGLEKLEGSIGNKSLRADGLQKLEGRWVTKA